MILSPKFRWHLEENSTLCTCTVVLLRSERERESFPLWHTCCRAVCSFVSSPCKSDILYGGTSGHGLTAWEWVTTCWLTMKLFSKGTDDDDDDTHSDGQKLSLFRSGWLGGWVERRKFLSLSNFRLNGCVYHNRVVLNIFQQQGTRVK